MIDTDTVKGLLERHHPSCTVSSVERAGSGRRWEVFKVEWKAQITWATQDYRTVAVRVRRVVPGELVSSEPRVYPSFTRSSIFPEPLSMIRWPEDYHLEVYQWMEGVSVKGSTGAGFKHLADLARDLFRLHSEPLSILPSTLPRFTGDWWRARVQDGLDESITYLSDHGLYSPVACSGTGRTLVTALEALSPVRISLLHGDLSPTNVLVQRDDPSQVGAIVDWDTAHYGDYLWDLASWACFHLPAHPDEVTRMLRLYHGLDGTDEQLHPATLHRFWVYAAVIAINRTASLRKLGYKDLTRAQSRITMALTHLSP